MTRASAAAPAVEMASPRSEPMGDTKDSRRSGAPAAPISSMTGAGVASGPTELGDLAVQVRAVNGRTLAIKTRLSADCQGLDHAIEGLVRARLRRGTVVVVAEVAAGTWHGQFAIDEELAAQALTSLRGLAKRLGLPDADVDLRVLLAVPGVVQSSSTRSKLAFDPPPAVAALLERAVDDLVANRRAEGAAIVAEMERMIDDLERAHQRVERRLPEVIAGYRARLLARVNEFLAGRARPLESGDVVREVALFADRADVSEEMQRIAGHVAQARAVLAGGGEVGRRLEFLLQEMLRETNTLGSKSPDNVVAAQVVDMKSLIDKMKEQAANLE
jgi:uncharacterized protein (TIGR00255 family)